MISFEKCKKILTAIWLVGFIIPFLILSAQTLLGTFWAGKESEAWALFTPMVLPTVGLIIGVLVADALNPAVEDRKITSTIFWVTVVLSLLYLGLVNAIFIAMPSLAAINADAAAAADAQKSSALLDSFKRSGLMLGAIQGLVTATLAVFFVNKNTKSAKDSERVDGPTGQTGANKATEPAKK